MITISSNSFSSNQLCLSIKYFLTIGKTAFPPPKLIIDILKNIQTKYQKEGSLYDLFLSSILNYYNIQHMIIDLHGMTVEDSISYILTSLLSLDISFHDTLTIITGNGFGFLMSSTLNLLDEEDRDYIVDKGKIIVYKKDKEDVNDFSN